MIVIPLVCLALAVIGGLVFKFVRPEAAVAREAGRALMWAGIFGIVWALALGHPALLVR